MKQLKSYKLILFIGFFFVTDITSASSKNKFDGSGMICPAENAVASNTEKKYGRPPQTLVFWFEQGSVVEIKNYQNKYDSDLDAQSQTANYYSNDEELWFDLGYTFSLNLKTLQLYWVISMGGDTTLRNKKCQLFIGDKFWRELDFGKP